MDKEFPDDIYTKIGGAIGSALALLLFGALPFILCFCGYLYGGYHYITHAVDVAAPWYKVVIANMGFYLSIPSMLWIKTIYPGRTEGTTFLVVYWLMVASLVFGIAGVAWHIPFYKYPFCTILWGL